MMLQKGMCLGGCVIPVAMSKSPIYCFSTFSDVVSSTAAFHDIGVGSVAVVIWTTPSYRRHDTCARYASRCLDPLWKIVHAHIGFLESCPQCCNLCLLTGVILLSLSFLALVRGDPFFPVYFLIASMAQVSKLSRRLLSNGVCGCYAEPSCLPPMVACSRLSLCSITSLVHQMEEMEPVHNTQSTFSPAICVPKLVPILRGDYITCYTAGQHCRALGSSEVLLQTSPGVVCSHQGHHLHNLHGFHW
jgi:hypothetical protein